MRNLILLLAAVLILVPVVASAGAPLVGTYSTLGSTMLPGRATESMPADFAEGQVGNMIHGESWNGALGTEWKITCAALGWKNPVQDYRDGAGNGLVIYTTYYTGGKLWLSSAGLWGNGDPEYTSDLTTFIVTAYKTYVAGNPIPTSVKSNIGVAGKIDGYDSCFDLAIANAELAGFTPTILANYPAFQGPTDCSDVGLHGTYWNVDNVSLNLYGPCVVPTQSSTWGAIKTLYR